MTIRTAAIVDTGSEMTIIDPSIAADLALAPIRTMPMRVVDDDGASERQAPVYAIRLTIGDPPLTAAPIEISVLGARIVGAQCLIGRDLLQRGGLAWYGDIRRFQLVLPI